MNPFEKLIEIHRKEEKLVIGLMSGTSADGVSAVVVKIRGSGINTKFKILAYNTYPYPESIRRRVFELFDPNTGKVDKICLMNYVLAELFADACFRIVEEAGLSMRDIDLIGSHGQTIYHMPDPVTVDSYRIRSTLQIVEPSVIAARTGVVTVADFRHKDVAVGGQGAPISAYVDYIIFRSEYVNRAIQNIGGIANVTYIPAQASIDDVMAFDTGPGNMIIDAIVSHITGGKMSFDADGKIAAKGRVNERLLSRLMEHEFIKRPPPKTTGREEFGVHYALKVYREGKRMGLSDEDIVATVTAFTALSIKYNYENYLGKVDEVIVGGGGSYNKTLLKMLREYLYPAEVRVHEDYGIPAQAKEPLIIAILANETISGNYNNVTTATGAKRRVVMGKIVLGE